MELEKKTTLKCGIGSKECLGTFECEHVWAKSIDGIPVKVPHCFKCFYDMGQCPDKHGVQCPACAAHFPEFNPKTYEAA